MPTQTVRFHQHSAISHKASWQAMNDQSIHHLYPESSDNTVKKRKNIKLLIVEDDDVDRERIRRYLKKLKLPVTVSDVSTGSEALRHVQNEEFDLMLLDYHLGDMTGADLISQFNEQDNSDILTIMITGMGDERTALEAMHLGVFDYLPKNALTAESLVTALEAAIGAFELGKKLKETQKKLHRLSLYDSLTGLANRNLFFDRIDQILLNCERYEGNFSLFMIDLNKFKEINDSLGHPAGDKVLKTIGERLQTTARKSDTVARLGGDEFVFILRDTHTREGVISFIKKLIETISQPMALMDRIVQVGASIGIAHYPDHGTDVGTLLSNADSAMYQAKKTNSNYVIYNKSKQKSSNLFTVCQHLHEGIKAKELFIEYQPKIDLNSRNFVGAEVLVRWQSPKLGLVMPNEFIPPAERSNLIEAITYTTMELAFEQLAKWHASGNKLKLALNISAKLLDNERLAHRLLNELNAQKLCAQDISLEITETSLASSGSCAHKVLMSLIDAGFEISIDDFGSGFTSFRYIRDVEFVELKIDRLFIDKLKKGSRDAEIVHSMILLAKGLGMRTVAEGVETQEQWLLLNKLGCKYGQGFGIAKPMSAIDLISWKNSLQEMS